MGLPLNGILRCQCFLQALVLIFFLSRLPSSHRCFFMVAYWLHCLVRQWICREEQPYPAASQEPWGQCKAEPRIVGFDSCRSSWAWPGCSTDFGCFLISREGEVIKLLPETWEAESAVKSFNTVRNLRCFTILPLRMLWGGTCSSHFEALIKKIHLVVHFSSIICFLMQVQAFKPPYVRLNVGLRVIQGHPDWLISALRNIAQGLAQAYSLIFLPQVLLISLLQCWVLHPLWCIFFPVFHIVVLFLAIVWTRNNSQGAAGHLHRTAVLEIIAPSVLAPFQVRLGSSQSKSWLLLVQKWAGLPSLSSAITFCQLLELF